MSRASLGRMFRASTRIRGDPPRNSAEMLQQNDLVEMGQEVEAHKWALISYL